MDKFHGYKIETNNVERLNKVLQAAKSNMTAAANELYHKLLSEEITELVDNIAMNIIARPQGSLIDVARGTLMDKIRFSEARGLPTEYNLATSIQVIPSNKVCYLMFCGTNAFLEEAFASTQGIEDYSVALKEGNEADNILTEREQQWLRLQKQCEAEPAILFANLSMQVSLDRSLLIFADKTERAAVRARHELTNQFINMYAAGKQIQPYELMSFMDKSLSQTLSDSTQAKQKELEMRLLNILPDITLDLLEPPAPQE